MGIESMRSGQEVLRDCMDINRKIELLRDQQHDIVTAFVTERLEKFPEKTVTEGGKTRPMRRVHQCIFFEAVDGQGKFYAEHEAAGKYDGIPVREISAEGLFGSSTRIASEMLDAAIIPLLRKLK